MLWMLVAAVGALEALTVVGCQAMEVQKNARDIFIDAGDARLSD